MASPVTLAQARALWPDADTIPDDVLQQLLDASWEQCLAFLPAAVVTAAVWSESHLLANVLQARGLWTAYRTDGDVIGTDNYAIRVRPLGDSVKALLRPRTGTYGVA